MPEKRVREYNNKIIKGAKRKKKMKNKIEKTGER